MTEQSLSRLMEENSYLKRRCAQLQEDVTDLSAEIERLRQQLERSGLRRLGNVKPDPLAGGQSL